MSIEVCKCGNHIDTDHVDCYDGEGVPYCDECDMPKLEPINAQIRMPDMTLWEADKHYAETGDRSKLDEYYKARGEK